jgi:hypothetical protein
MPTKPKIPPALHALVMQLAAEGKTGEQIAQVLWREHKIEASERAVQRLLEKHAEERKAINKAVVREATLKYLLPALKKIARGIERADRISREARARAIDLRTGPNGHPHHPLADQHELLALKAIDRVDKGGNYFLHYAGLNQPDKPGAAAGKVTDAREALLQRIKVLAGVADPKTEPQVH